jgi:hypothetical protein
MKIRIKDYIGIEHSGYWNGSFYSSKDEDTPNLKRVYIDGKMIHLSYEAVEDLRKNLNKYTRAYDSGLYETNIQFFNKLLNWQTEEIKTWDNIKITSWNHLKQQYIAIIERPSEEFGLIRVFISEKDNITGSGANADLLVTEPIEIGTLIEIKDGSHKNMYQDIYRKVENGWMRIATRKNKEAWEIISGNMCNDPIEYVEPKKPKKNEEIINPLAKFTDEELSAELRKRGYDISFTDTRKTCVLINGKNLGRFTKLELV